MKILHVSHFFPPHIGGGETYIYNLCKELAKSGHDVKVITSNIPRSQDYELINGVKVLRLPAKMMYFTPIMPSLAFNLLRINPDIIHGHMPPPYAADIAAFFSKVKNVPYILTYYTDIIPPSTKGTLMVNLYYSTIGIITLHTARKIITATSIIKDTSKWLKPVKDKVEVVPYGGVDLVKFNPGVSGESIRQYFQISDDEKLLLFVGRLTFYKGIEYLLRALPLIKKKIGNVKLMIVGEGYLKKRFKELCASLQIEGSVIFAGQVPDSILPKYYAAADLFVLPSTSRAEGFGIVLLEAMASGKPVIASRVGGIPEVVMDSCNGILVTPRKIMDLAEAVINLLSNTEIARKMGQKGRKIVEKKFSWKHIADRTLSLYEEVLQQASS